MNRQAYVPTIPTKLENCEQCFTVAFCDPFFKLDRIVEVVDGNQWKEENLNDPKLISQEHAIFHEWMHVDLMGQDWHSKFPSITLCQLLILCLVTDLKDRDVKVDGFKHSVYGADLCSDYAWKFADERKVNYEIRENGKC